MNVSESILNGVVTASESEQFVRQLNLPMTGGSFIATAVLITFGVGLLLVFVYAAIRPRFGSRAQTAIVAGLVVWALVYVYGGVLLHARGLFPTGLTLLGMIWTLVETPLAALAGAWAYKE